MWYWELKPHGWTTPILRVRNYMRAKMFAKDLAVSMRCVVDVRKVWID